MDARRRMELRENPGRILAAALARLVDAYEFDSARARHVLEWEHLLGSRSSTNPVGPEHAKHVSEVKRDAEMHQWNTMLYRTQAFAGEFEKLLDDWDEINSPASASDFELDNFLNDNRDDHWRVTGAGMTPTEQFHFFGWTPDEVNRLAQSNPEMIARITRELEEVADKNGLRGEDAHLFVRSRLDDLPAIIKQVLDELRKDDFHRRHLRWREVEEKRPLWEYGGLLHSWRSLRESNPSIEIPPPEHPNAANLISLKKNLPDDARHIYERLQDLMFKRGGTRNSESLAQCEALLDKLIEMSRSREESVGLLTERELNEEARIERGREPILGASCWYDYYSAAMDDEALEAAERVNQDRSHAKLYTQWARELIGLLPSLVDRSASLEPHPISEIGDIPMGLRTLFEQAHLSYIFGLEIPCVISCGSLIEEAIEVKFPELREKWEEWSKANDGKQVGWKFKKKDVLEIFPRFDRVSRKANSVVYERNDAVHNPDKFLRGLPGRQASILRNTRDVLENLFEAGESGEERKRS